MRRSLLIVFQELTLEGLSVYLNCNTVQFSEKTPEEMMQLFKSGIVTRDDTPQGYDYSKLSLIRSLGCVSSVAYDMWIVTVLGPINSSARLRINPKPELDGSDYTIPKMELTLELETLSVSK